LPYPAPADLAPYRAAFRCAMSFEAPATSLLFAHADLTQLAQLGGSFCDFAGGGTNRINRLEGARS